ncbi:developmentally-regulated protein [Acrasis kona]|uniref:Developmentally-regulated protein n=1 Tax=Acrasis kona TaxID=1008807 RepID=A0AAW2YUY9_9EUKA
MPLKGFMNVRRLLAIRRSPQVQPQQYRKKVYFTPTFPSVQLPVSWGLPIEVVLIGQIGHGGGSALVQQVKDRQKKHKEFIDELDEPSAKLFNTSLGEQVKKVEDKTAVYTFSVDQSHPFHRHEGHRVFTAVTGSRGCFLRFSTATKQEVEEDANAFIKQLSQVHIPGDCIFTLRFNGSIWHQFSAAGEGSPAFFAISVHTDETGGQLKAEDMKKVLSNQASIASLTEVVPEQIQKILQQPDAFQTVPTYHLSLEPGGPIQLRDLLCKVYRSGMGRIRSSASAFAAKLRGGDGHMIFPQQKRNYSTTSSNTLLADQEYLVLSPIIKNELSIDSIMDGEFENIYHFQDSFTICITAPNGSIDPKSLIKQDDTLRQMWKDGKCNSDEIMERLLSSFVDHPPTSVGRYMHVRNVMVRPLKLRTSPLGCPVSSLLGKSEELFGSDRKFPVKKQSSSPSGLQTQVLLGANDKHLRFRSVVSTELIPKEESEKSLESIVQVNVTLSNRVHCLNWFGFFYMWLIHIGHERLVVPPLLQQGCKYAFGK